jgi:hypothetical protein
MTALQASQNFHSNIRRAGRLHIARRSASDHSWRSLRRLTNWSPAQNFNTRTLGCRFQRRDAGDTMTVKTA